VLFRVLSPILALWTATLLPSVSFADDDADHTPPLRVGTQAFQVAVLRPPATRVTVKASPSTGSAALTLWFGEDRITLWDRSAGAAFRTQELAWPSDLNRGQRAFLRPEHLNAFGTLKTATADQAVRDLRDELDALSHQAADCTVIREALAVRHNPTPDRADAIARDILIASLRSSTMHPQNPALIAAGRGFSVLVTSMTGPREGRLQLHLTFYDETGTARMRGAAEVEGREVEQVPVILQRYLSVDSIDVIANEAPPPSDPEATDH